LDCGELDNIHPTDKKPVGERLCLQAEKLAYGMNVKADGAMLERVSFENNKAVLTLKNAEGLEFRGEKAAGFELAGEDGDFKPADAVIEGEKVVLTSAEVREPKFASYCWTNYGEVNVYNDAGIPLAPFNTKEENYRR
ncbi:MAG: sialate O-acetylesterase, partial [Ruminococcus sp.]|nr:sialate O-acetylesterase [Ruminococcus sp.]